MDAERYTGEIIEIAGWSTRYRVTKDDGTLTDSGSYQSLFEIGPDRFVVMPYWHELAYPVVLSSAEVLNLVKIS